MISAIPRLPVTLAMAWLIVAATACSFSSKPLNIPLTVQANIQLPRDVGKPSIDLLSLDPRRGFLYVSHSSASSLDIVDLKTRKVVARVGGLPGIRAIAVTSDPNIVFTSNVNGTVGVVDVSTFKVVGKVQVGGSPDAIDYDPTRDHVLVSLGVAQKLVLIDRVSLKLVGTVDLPGKPELMAVDAQGSRLFLAINNKDEVITINLATLQIQSTYKGCDITAPTGVAYDPEQGRLFVAVKAEVSVIDAVLDRCLGAVDVGSGTDQIAFNPHRHHLYAANAGTRNLSVIDTVSLKPLGIVGTGSGAATVTADPTTDMVYVAVGRAGIIAPYHDP
jgi:DNA-binding beta-propeller fold protein YncE